MTLYMQRATGSNARMRMIKSLKSSAIQRNINLSLKDEDAVRLVAEIEAKGEIEKYARETSEEFANGAWERAKARPSVQGAPFSSILRTITPQPAIVPRKTKWTIRKLWPRHTPVFSVADCR